MEQHYFTQIKVQICSHNEQALNICYCSKLIWQQCPPPLCPGNQSVKNIPTTQPLFNHRAAQPTTTAEYSRELLNNAPIFTPTYGLVEMSERHLPRGGKLRQCRHPLKRTPKISRDVNSLIFPMSEKKKKILILENCLIAFEVVSYSSTPPTSRSPAGLKW